MFRTILSRTRSAPAIKTAEDETIQCLGRRPVNLDTPQLRRFLADKRVLVTGAGGSIGSEICRQVLRFAPRCLILLERAENPLFEIDRELAGRFGHADIRPYIADICDPRRIAELFHSQLPQVVFHCAAHKHVPMMERNAAEAVKNNVLGTQVVADAAAAIHVEAFVLISTDKAVNPTSIMGASKRCAELYIQSIGASSQCRGRFVCVRFGNVWGSSGSVAPIFARQIAAGGPVTVTHPDMRRYFMTIPEASQLVMQAGAIGRGGEVFVLDMGQPLRIVDIARAMIRNRGLRPDKDIRIHFTGIRPGEKLFEELSCGNEQIAPTAHPSIHIWKLPAPDPSDIQRMMQLLSEAAGKSDEHVRAALRQAVVEYRAADPQPLRLAAEKAA